MKTFPAIAAIEFQHISVGMYATDLLLKKAPIAFFKSGTITRGRYLTLIGGTTAPVEESFEEGLFWGGANVLDSVMLADIHPQLHDAILGRRQPNAQGSMAIFETESACSSIRLSELVLKNVPVTLVELRLADSGLSGKGVSIYRGELSDIEAAADIALSAQAGRQGEFSHKVITQPHEGLGEHLAVGTLFATSRMVELDGEVLG